MDKNLKKLAEPGVRLHLVILVIFAAASLYFKLYELALSCCCWFTASLQSGAGRSGFRPV